MKRSLYKRILFSFLLTLALPLSAQVRFGFRTGIGSSSLIQRVEGSYVAGARFGYNIGVVSEIAMKNGFAFRPELYFLNQGGSYRTQKYAKEVVLNPPLVKACLYSLQLPANFAYNIKMSDMRVSLIMGPVLDYTFKGDLTYNKDYHLASFGTEEQHDFKPFDLAFNIGLAAEHKRVFFQINGIFGLLDRRSAPFMTESILFQNNVSLSVGYFFY